MGIDLKLLPMHFHRDEDAYSHTILPLNACFDLFEKIHELPALQVPSRFHTYLNRSPEESTENTQTDPYGEPLRYVRAEDLLTLRDHEGVRLYGHENAAAWAYLAHMPADAKVCLYWE